VSRSRSGSRNQRRSRHSCSFGHFESCPHVLKHFKNDEMLAAARILRGFGLWCSHTISRSIYCLLLLLGPGIRQDSWYSADIGLFDDMIMQYRILLVTPLTLMLFESNAFQDALPRFLGGLEVLDIGSQRSQRTRSNERRWEQSVVPTSDGF
jgi:hypothetical protein